MGAAIAAHLANAGVRVLMLDIVPVNVKDAGTREAAETLYASLEAAGVEVLYDDRNNFV